jgi:gluconolactonase
MKLKVHDPMEFEVIATELGFPEGPVMLDDGAVLVVDIESGNVLRIEDGAVKIVASPGGGPNGLALRDHSSAVVANNGGFLWTKVNDISIPIDHETHTNEPPGFSGGWMEEIDLATGDVSRLHDEYDGHSLRGPNDLVFDAVGGYWFTDHGKGRLESVDRGALFYAAPDGELRRVAFPLLGPNGVGLSPDESIVYAAETHTGRLWAWDLA